MPVGSTTVTCTSRPSWRASRLAASVPPTPPPSTTTLAGIAAHRAFRTRKRVKPSSAATSTSSCRALATQAGMSVAEPASLDQTSTTAPTSRWRIAPISDSSGPGQAIPRASITWSVVTWLIVISSVSDEDELAVGGEHEGGDTLHVVHQRVEVVLGQPEQVHRQRAGVHAYLAELLGLGQDRAPVLAAALGLQPPHRGGAAPAVSSAAALSFSSVPDNSAIVRVCSPSPMSPPPPCDLSHMRMATGGQHGQSRRSRTPDPEVPYPPG